MAKGGTTADGGGAATGTGHQEKVPDTKKKAAAAAGEEEEEEQLVIRAPVHCDGCGRKLRRSLQRLQGVGEVTVDSRTNTVVVRGRTAVDNATEVVQVVERRTGEKAAVLQVTPSSSAPNKKHDANTRDDVRDDELPEVNMKMVTVLKINLHCDACSEEIKRRILKITGVEEAVPHLKSSQVMVKGKVEPATLVGFIHKCTGRRAAIVRAGPLDDLLLQSPNSPAPPPVVMVAPPAEEAESKKDEPPPENPPGEKKNGGRQDGNKEKKNEEPNEESKGEGHQELDHVDEKNPETDKPGDGGGGHGAAGEHGTTHDGGGHGGALVLENHHKDDRLFTVPMPAGVVTVAPEMALSDRSFFYPAYPCYAQCYYPYQQYHQYPPQAYPAYACSPAASMYGYGYPANYPPGAFSEENPNACTIV